MPRFELTKMEGIPSQKLLFRATHSYVRIEFWPCKKAPIPPIPLFRLGIFNTPLCIFLGEVLGHYCSNTHYLLLFGLVNRQNYSLSGQTGWPSSYLTTRSARLTGKLCNCQFNRADRLIQWIDQPGWLPEQTGSSVQAGWSENYLRQSFKIKSSLPKCVFGQNRRFSVKERGNNPKTYQCHCSQL